MNLQSELLCSSSSQPAPLSSRSSRNNSTIAPGALFPETIQKRVMKSVLEYNRQLNQERNEDRRVCMDLQTYTVQYPVGLGRSNLSLRRRRPRLGSGHRRGRYPVALLPDQYQDWYLKYTTNELKYFPLNTVLHGPLISDRLLVNQSVVNGGQNYHQTSNMDNSDSSDFDGSEVLSDLDDDSTSCSCGDLAHSPSMVKDDNGKSPDDNNHNDNSFMVDENSCPQTNGQINDKNQSFLHQALNNGTKSSKPDGPNGQIINDNNNESSGQICRMCNLSIDVNDNALCCADCNGMTHPKCLEIHGELLEAIRQYEWQCQYCKTCQQCGQPHDEDKMMFCDKCDRGYHTFCVGLDHIPVGHWVCGRCAVCANCGTKKPSGNDNSRLAGTSGNVPNDSTAPSGQWQHEFIKIHSPDGQTMIRHSVFCETCYKLRKL